MLKNLIELIKDSTKDLTGKFSHTKISSYFILGSILTSTLTVVIIDMGNAILKWKNGEVYTIPIEHTLIFSLILTHHLVLLGLKKSADTKNIATIANSDSQKNLTEIIDKVSEINKNTDTQSEDNTEEA